MLRFVRPELQMIVHRAAVASKALYTANKFLSKAFSLLLVPAPIHLKALLLILPGQILLAPHLGLLAI